MPAERHPNPAFWIPTLYFTEGVPAAIVTNISTLVFLTLAMDQGQIVFWVNFFGLAWIIKPLWSPLIDIFRTKRFWIILTQILMGLFLIVGAGALCGTPKEIVLIVCFMLTALASATHDIAADGFYILALPEHDQAVYSGLRSVFYRCALLAANGALAIFAGLMIRNRWFNSPCRAWAVCLLAAALYFLLIGWYHVIVLPKTETPAAPSGASRVLKLFGNTFVTFFRRKHVWRILLFLLLYRFAEAQLGTVGCLFLLDRKGGAGLTTLQYGLASGTIGVAMLLAGGVLGGILTARFGLGRTLWPMFLAMNVPDLVYVFMAWLHPASMTVISACIAFEQFGYGIGFTSFMLVMIWFAGGSGENKTSHFALMTVFMILGLRLPGMISGWILKLFQNFTPGDPGQSYLLFFCWVIVSILPAAFGTMLLMPVLDRDFGLRHKETPGA